MIMRTIGIALCVGVLSMALGCSPEPPAQPPEGAGPELTNRIPVPPEVITNIGITFATAERGRLHHWLRVSGSLELPDDRRWRITAPVQGRIEMRVRVGESIQEGDTLGTLKSPAIAEIQESLLLAQSRVQNASEDATAARERLAGAEELCADAQRLEAETESRWQRLRQAVRKSESSVPALSGKELVEAEKAYVDSKSSSLESLVRRDELKKLSRTLALEQRRAQLEFSQRLLSLSVLTGQSVESLVAVADEKPHWQMLTELEIRSPGSGIVLSVPVAAREHVPEGAVLASVADPSTLVFRGFLPESDLTRLTLGAPIRIEAAGAVAPVETSLWDSPPAFDRDTRSILVSAWVPNPSLRIPQGISATAHVLLSEGKNEEVLLQDDCVIFDGLEAVVFLRDPSDPDSVTRTPVELGNRSGGTYEILAGVLDGDEVVLDGAHQLKQTGMGKAPEGGHFHADGTWHEGH